MEARVWIRPRLGQIMDLEASALCFHAFDQLKIMKKNANLTTATHTIRELFIWSFLSRQKPTHTISLANVPNCPRFPATVMLNDPLDPSTIDLDNRVREHATAWLWRKPSKQTEGPLGFSQETAAFKVRRRHGVKPWKAGQSSTILNPKAQGVIL